MSADPFDVSAGEACGALQTFVLAPDRREWATSMSVGDRAAVGTHFRLASLLPPNVCGPLGRLMRASSLACPVDSLVNTPVFAGRRIPAFLFDFTPSHLRLGRWLEDWWKIAVSAAEGSWKVRPLG